MSDLNSSSHSENEESSNSSDSEDHFVFAGEYLPYQDEPLASGSESEDAEEEDENDEDGLSVAVLRQRYEREIAVQAWCQCGKCDVSLLVGAREFRCCHEIIEAVGKFTFIGLTPTCITEHQDFGALTNKTVLMEVGPL